MVLWHCTEKQCSDYIGIKPVTSKVTDTFEQ